MDIVIGGLDASTATPTVPVTFTVPGKEPFQRPVNVVLDEHGEYDAEATRARIENELAPGVQAKFNIGIIGNPPSPAPELPGSEAE